ncbi:hypothetical protein EC973_000194 [Apophysomyces ossiformis]|uniref:Uncharacterized protein n=1 Tax=Apophysomyces ossiformis TaxID=679940 RepID=A0A8H7BY97_9FUNG|nr:hypothetical protein EC973_000194 [Apophysomyces ossiformis]
MSLQNMNSNEDAFPSPEQESNSFESEEIPMKMPSDETDSFGDDHNTLPITTNTNTTASNTSTADLSFNDDDFNKDNNEDDFGDFDNDFQDAENDDDFGDFDDFETTIPPEENIPPVTPSQADEYIKILEEASSPDEIADYVHRFMKNLWSQEDISSMSTVEDENVEEEQDSMDILCTECSHGLWDKLSCDSVFYNPITGAIGQFQWTQSETNRAYLNALGVTINYDDRARNNGPSSTSTSPGPIRRPQSSNYADSKSSNASTGNINRRASPSHTRSASLSGMTVSGNSRPNTGEENEDEGEHAVRKPVEQEPELDLDIAKAYCELTEETIRVFPKEKLQAMIGELSRLQRQATEYLGYLLDQREQLMMDAETYNDLISCIVGHAQRLREQNVGKDASPAMVNKKKKSSGLNMLRRKPTVGGPVTHSASMGGGVVGLKQSTGNAPKKPGVTEGRRSM